MKKSQLFTFLIRDLRRIILSARSHIVKNINTVQVLANFEIGRQIIQYEQKGSKRTEYGKQVLKELARRLSDEFGMGFSERNLRNIRKFYLVYQD